MALRSVDKLTITFLVDNNIEWMTKLPPGFTHELPRHVHQTHNDPELGVPVLDFDNFCCGAHGFGVLIASRPRFLLTIIISNSSLSHKQETHVASEKKENWTLFDTGPDSQSLVRNIKGLKIPFREIERVVTSHWHSDHTGGLLSFLDLWTSPARHQHQHRHTSHAVVNAGAEVNVSDPTITVTTSVPVHHSDYRVPPSIVVDVHPDRPSARGIAPGPLYDKVICALQRDPSFEEITQRRGVVLEKHGEPHVVADGTVYVSGEIPRVTEWEQGLHGGARWRVGEDGIGKWESEQHIMDERYAAVDVAGKGLILFSSCSHAGIVNVVKNAVDVFKRPIYMIVGGLHLAGPEFGLRIPPTVEFLSETLRPSPTYILPMHCTGFQAKLALEKAFGEGCVPTGVGHKIEIVGDRQLDGRLMESSY